MNTPHRNLSPEYLAGYADGELNDAAARRVEQFLRNEPEAQADLEAQQQLSPQNQALWEAAEPNEPSAFSWAKLEQRIQEGVADASRRRSRRRVVSFALAGAAAMLAFAFLLRPDAAPPEAVKPEVDFALAPAVLQVATDDDVEIVSLEGSHWHALPVGDPHVPGPLVLAEADDIRLEGVDQDPAWPDGEPRMTLAPGDAPLLYALQSESR